MSELRKLGTFAGNDALVAFARLYKVNVVIHQLDSASFNIEGGVGDSSSLKELHLTYHNGEHYSSIRRIGDKSSSPANIRFKPQVCIIHTHADYTPDKSPALSALANTALLELSLKRRSNGSS